MKVCIKCKTTKDIIKFSKRKGSMDGRRNTCKECASLYDMGRKDRKSKTDRQRYLSKAEEIKQKNKNYYRKNRSRYAILEYERRAISKKATLNGYEDGIMLILEERDVLQAISGEDLVIDHIIPLKNGRVCGLNVPWNLQILTRSENASKNNKFDGTYENESWRDQY
jgi:5-methylcytosine-specific restriction endonuclease McrA